jgi:hypothetical protein
VEVTVQAGAASVGGEQQQEDEADEERKQELLSTLHGQAKGTADATWLIWAHLWSG